MPPGRLATWLACAAICAELCISANLLTWMGVPYVSDGGALPLKLHPGTDLLLAACLAELACGQLAWLKRIDTLLWLFFSAITLCLLSVILLSGPGNLIVLLDTFLPAGLLAAVLGHAGPTVLLRLRLAMQFLFAVNAALALGETAAQSTLIPLYLNDNAYHPLVADFRPTALFDHPLTGALMTMIGLALTPRSGRIRLPYVCLLSAALVAFGGRMALGVTVLSALLVAGWNGARLILLRDRRAIWTLLAAGGATVACAALFMAALFAGLGDRLSGHLYWDSSAQVRLAQWQILGQLDGWQILFGTPRDQLLQMLNALRLGTGVEVIENFWLLMFVSLGLVGFPFFLTGLFALCTWCWGRTDSAGRTLLVGALVVASSSNSLGRKSTVLVCLVAALICMQRRAVASRPVRSRWFAPLARQAA